MRNLLLVFLVMMTLPLCACAGNIPQNDGSTSTPGHNKPTSTAGGNTSTPVAEETSAPNEDGRYVGTVSPANQAKIALLSSDVSKFYTTVKFGSSSLSAYLRTEDLYYPKTVEFKWEADNKAKYYRLYLSTDQNFAQFDSYVVNQNSFTINYLFTGTTYYWQLHAVGEDGYVAKSNVYTFSTEQGPRCLEIRGVSNTRDIGGMYVQNGKYRIKQGLIYRGAELEGITGESKTFMLDYLGIKTDMDLRGPEAGASPLGQSINYVNFDGRHYVGDMGISNEAGKKVFAEEIRVFANLDNYPIYFHCAMGRDRTGTLAFVIEALLGASETDLRMDFELSALSVKGCAGYAVINGYGDQRNAINNLYAYIKTFQGADLAEKTENYLLGIGITAKEIQTIRNLMLEEVK